MIYDTYSKRTKRTKWLEKEQYSEIPRELRNQIVSILDLIIQYWEWQELWHAFCDEKGIDKTEKQAFLPPDYPDDCEELVIEKYQSYCHQQVEKRIEDAFDLIDIAFQIACKNIKNARTSDQKNLKDMIEKYHQAVKEINVRFEEANVGYRLVNNRIERKVLHLDLALPALDTLHGKDFRHTKNNFYLAHRHYQNKNYGDCVSSANKSFESLLKALCKRRNLYKQQNLDEKTDAPIGNLVNILCKDLFPNGKFIEKFQPITLKLLPVVRANFGGHGENPEDEETPDFIARYALHLAATNILFFMQAVEDKNEPTESENTISTDKTSTDETSNSNSPTLDDDIPF